jgi:hypothetical protein
MHDPSFLALSIRRPWPQRSSFSASGSHASAPRWKCRRGSPFMTFTGRDLYFPSLISVWHHEPGGRDSGEVCGYPHGLALLRHLRHLSVNVEPIGRFYRWAFTRCSWCGGPSRKGNTVNCKSPGGLDSGERTNLPWWHGEQGIMHGGCTSAADAYRTCICPEPELATRWRFPWSYCARCSGSRFHDADMELVWIYTRTRQLVRKGHAPTPEARAEIQAMWKQRRAAKA